MSCLFHGQAICAYTSEKGTTDEFLLSGRAEEVAAYGPGINDRLQWQSRKQCCRVVRTGRISEGRQISKEYAGRVQGYPIGGHGPQF